MIRGWSPAAPVIRSCASDVGVTSILDGGVGTVDVGFRTNEKLGQDLHSLFCCLLLLSFPLLGQPISSPPLKNFDDGRTGRNGPLFASAQTAHCLHWSAVFRNFLSAELYSFRTEVPFAWSALKDTHSQFSKFHFTFNCL
jgi:hypothetical protein